MTLYPDNIREFVTQESVALGESGYDVEVEIVRKSELEIMQRDGCEVVSIGLKQVSPLPPMEPDDLLVVFDLGTVLEIDDVRFADPENGSRLPIESTAERLHGGPIRIPTVLTDTTRISLLISAGQRPLGTLTVGIEHDGRITDTTFLPENDSF